MLLGNESATQPPTSRFGAQRLYRDAGSMAVSSVANAILGIGFWAIAAKIFPPEKLGVMTAVLAVILAVAAVVAAGVGDAYTALLPAAGSARLALYRRGQQVFFALAAVAGIGAAVCTILLLPEVRGSVAVGALVAIGVLIWSALALQNSTLVALGRARWLPAANIAASLAKIALLPLLAITLSWHAVELSFVISAFVMVVVLRPFVGRMIESGKDLPPATMPEDQAGRMFNKFVAQTVAASALTFGLITATPFLVTLYAGPTQGALYALALLIMQALDFIGAALTVSLVVHASSSPEQAGAMARATLIRLVPLVAVGSIGLVLLAPIGLRMLNPQYGAMGATAVMAVMCAGSVVRTVCMVWTALQRARRNMTLPLIFNFVAAVMLMALMPGLCDAFGALGGAIALLLACSAFSVAATVHYLLSRRRGEGAIRGAPQQD